MVATLFWVGLAGGVLIPAVLAATVKRHMLGPVLLLAFLSPVAAYAVLVVAPMLFRSSGTEGVGTAMYGFMLVSPLLAPPWMAVFLLGLALGFTIRRVLRRRQSRPAKATAAPLPPRRTPGWRSVHIGFEDDGLRIGGLAVWQQKWRPAGLPPVWVPHPAHPNELHSLDIYTIGHAASPIRFAAGELSNGVWGFAIEENEATIARGVSEDGTLA